MPAWLAARKLRATSRYKKERLSFLRANPLCRICEAQGVVTPARDLDHITPAHIDITLFWDRENWQPLCADCHKVKSDAEKGRTVEVQAWLDHVNA